MEGGVPRKGVWRREGGGGGWQGAQRAGQGGKVDGTWSGSDAIVRSLGDAAVRRRGAQRAKKGRRTFKASSKMMGICAAAMFVRARC